MPTAARLVAALSFAAVAAYVSLIIQGYFEDKDPAPNLWWINALFGVIVGWQVAGPKGGQGARAMLGSWLTTTVALIFVCMFFNSAAEMIKRSLRKDYDRPVEAVVAVFEIMLEFAPVTLTQPVLILCFAGGLLAAFLTEVAGRLYR
ncbi:MAG: TrgA family protein [Pseudomonadota bacterium]